MIRNLKTGKVSPQYHVVYDDLFQTIPNVENGGIDSQEHPENINWDELISTSREFYLETEYNENGEVMEPPSLAKEWGYIKDATPKERKRSKECWKEDITSYEENHKEEQLEENIIPDDTSERGRRYPQRERKQVKPFAPESEFRS